MLAGLALPRGAFFNQGSSRGGHGFLELSDLPSDGTCVVPGLTPFGRARSMTVGWGILTTTNVNGIFPMTTNGLILAVVH